jgi:hypothetical protein
LRSTNDSLAAKMSSRSIGLLSIDTLVRSDEQWQKLGIKLLNQDCQNHDETLKLLE